MRRLERFERRLAPLESWLRVWSRAPERERRQREQRELLAAILRAGLEHARVDPNEASSLRHLEDPDWPPSFMRPRSFVHPLRRVAERQWPRTFIERLFDETRRYRHAKDPPDLRHASADELIGYYCFGDGNKDRPAGKAPQAIDTEYVIPGQRPALDPEPMRTDGTD